MCERVNDLTEQSLNEEKLHKYERQANVYKHTRMHIYIYIQR
jgi:hypothetical protein